MKFSIEALYNWYRGLLRNPKYRWWVVLGTFLYLVSPIDIAPDFLPIVGQLDDVLILTLLVSEVSQIAIEGFKARRGTPESQTANASSQSTSQTESIDVDAVSVE
ncbi:YkvA family protein [Calothrix sp. UHCC 0171]|uniref:YkvA family protein n=1 Tax=Calothrix sp. UHCC 0171 TaxID=3110245 RepID=UPI002B1F8B1C|nr:YkvA family protein [Calothrix sp. UHCC 0171]MEA5570660.1 YkvA family protein [Calothrix sp. UHCC 0171]